MNIQRYETVEEFWKITGFVTAICDICAREITRGGGYLLDTEEIVSSKWYREDAAPQAIKEICPKITEAELATVRRLQFVIAAGSRTQWLVCDGCYLDMKR